MSIRLDIVGPAIALKASSCVLETLRDLATILPGCSTVQYVQFLCNLSTSFDGTLDRKVRPALAGRPWNEFVFFSSEFGIPRP